MRKVDELFGSLSESEPDSPTPVADSIPVKRESSTQMRPRALDDISPPPLKRVSKPFDIPAGSPVIELSSDPESPYEENYADDEVDETYSPKSESLPRGDGWVKKRRRITRASII